MRSRRSWWLFGAMLLAFVCFRWWTRAHPTESDDTNLFEGTVALANGEHWLWPSVHLPNHYSDHALRIGLSFVGAPLVALFGANYLAYYGTSILFSIVALVVVWIAARRSLGVGPAIFAVALVFVHPLEVHVGLRYYVDQPAAALTLGALVALDHDSDRAGLVAGALLAWAYLLRTSAIIVAGPALLLFFLSPRARRATLIAGATLGAVIVVETAVHLFEGFPFLARFGAGPKTISDHYAGTPVTYLPIVNFLLRGFDGFAHVIAERFATPVLIFHTTFVLASGAAILFSRDRLLRIAAVFALTGWGMFSYAILRVDADGIAPMLRILPRYFHPLYYAGALSVAWLFSLLLRRHRLPAVIAGGALVVLGLVSSLRGLPERFAGSEIDQILDHLSAHEGEVHATRQAGRAFTLFQTDRTWRLYDDYYSYERALAAPPPPRLVLRNPHLEARHVDLSHGEAKDRLTASLNRSRRALFDSFRPVDAAGSFEIYELETPRPSQILDVQPELQALEPATTSTPAAYRMQTKRGWMILAKVCEDFTEEHRAVLARVQIAWPAYGVLSVEQFDADEKKLDVRSIRIGADQTLLAFQALEGARCARITISAIGAPGDLVVVDRVELR